MTRFLLIRHALTDTAGKRLVGRMEGVHLNAEGLEQAGHLALRLSGLKVNALYSSPLERALETAAPIGKLFHLESIGCNDFIEMDFGEWTNCLIEEIKDQTGFKQFNSFRSNTRIPGGEMMAEAQLRIISGIEILRRQHDGETVIIVSHSDLIKAAICWYAGIHLDLLQRIEVSPASVSIVELYDETARMVTINNTGELKF
ncbi:MAG: histidine phosphatase family protein [Ferruginibacter sp.]